jgi:hypothetical protein
MENSLFAPALRINQVEVYQQQPETRRANLRRGDRHIRYYWAKTRAEDFMADAVVDALILDLLEWLAKGDRSYEEVMDAWRTSCPKLPVWEEANDRGLLQREETGGRSVVRISATGRAVLERRRLNQSDPRDVIARSI